MDVKPSESKAVREAVAYFKAHPGFHRLFCGMREKYTSLGRPGGSVVLTRLTAVEQETFGGYYGKSFYQRNRVSLSMEGFDRQRAKTRYGDCTLGELLEAYFGEPLLWRKEEKANGEERRQMFYRELLKEFAGTDGALWMSSVLDERRNPLALWNREYKEEPTRLAEELRFVLMALSTLPVRYNETQRLPAFAAQISGDPHMFDEGRRAGRYLLYGIADLLGKDLATVGQGAIGQGVGQPTDQPDQSMGRPASRAKERGEVLFGAGLLKDDISNFVTAAGILAKRRRPNLDPDLSLNPRFNEDLDQDRALGLQADLDQDQALGLQTDLNSDQALGLQTDLDQDQALGLQTDLDQDPAGVFDQKLHSKDLLDPCRGRNHGALQDFYDYGEPVCLTLMNLSQLETVLAPRKRVLVLENPTVFAELMECVNQRKLGARENLEDSENQDLDFHKWHNDNENNNPRQWACALVCSSGQLKLAVTVLLDKLVDSGATLYYSGDFDPEGLLIAQRLKERYGKQLKLWHYSEADYNLTRSDRGIAANRLQQLRRLVDPELVAMGEILRREGKAGYQERLLDVLKAEVTNRFLSM